MYAGEVPCTNLFRKMLMPHRILDHTADLCIEVTADSFAGLLGEALRAMTRWMAPVRESRKVLRQFRVEASDRAALLVDFLNDALTISQIYREAYDAVSIDSIGESFVEGAFLGCTISGAENEIKAVTYHGVSVEEQADGKWVALLLMDI